VDERYKGIKPDKLPKVWFTHYVVYKYSWAESTYIVGTNSDVDADRLQNDLLTHKDLIRCEIYGHYPLELLK
jgi:hypothetical protein